MVMVLGLDQSGTPRNWLTVREAIEYVATEQVAWSLGDDIATYHGGIRRIDGAQSKVSTPAIIAIKSQGVIPNKMRKVTLTNRSLFARDRHFCGYCGRFFRNEDLLSRDHIIPRSKGGPDTWMNVVCACKKCNHKKDNQTPEEAGMQLIWVPFVPNHWEHMILQNRKIVADQFEFLASGISDHFKSRGDYNFLD